MARISLFLCVVVLLCTVCVSLAAVGSASPVLVWSTADRLQTPTADTAHVTVHDYLTEPELADTLAGVYANSDGSFKVHFMMPKLKLLDLSEPALAVPLATILQEAGASMEMHYAEVSREAVLGSSNKPQVLTCGEPATQTGAVFRIHSAHEAVSCIEAALAGREDYIATFTADFNMNRKTSRRLLSTGTGDADSGDNNVEYMSSDILFGLLVFIPILMIFTCAAMITSETEVPDRVTTQKLAIGREY
jgi:hypothetical protein